MMTLPPHTYPRPSLREWALLVVNLSFVANGLYLLPTNPDVGIVTITFFGSCAALFAVIIGGKIYRFEYASVRVDVTGGVPIRPSRSFLGMTSIALSGLGLVILVAGWRSGTMAYTICAAPFAGLGFWLLFGLATRRFPSGYLQFDPLGLTFGNRRTIYTVQWDNIAGITPAEIHAHSVLLIKIGALDRVSIWPPERGLQVYQQWHRNEGTTGAHVILDPAHYRMDQGLLMQTLHRYITDRASRSELARRDPRRNLATSAAAPAGENARRAL